MLKKYTIRYKKLFKIAWSTELPILDLFRRWKDERKDSWLQELALALLSRVEKLGSRWFQRRQQQRFRPQQQGLSLRVPRLQLKIQQVPICKKILAQNWQTLAAAATDWTTQSGICLARRRRRRRGKKDGQVSRFAQNGNSWESGTENLQILMMSYFSIDKLWHCSKYFLLDWQAWISLTQNFDFAERVSTSTAVENLFRSFVVVVGGVVVGGYVGHRPSETIDQRLSANHAATRNREESSKTQDFVI